MAIVTLLITTIAFNLGFSYRLFTNDKTSYIYENGLRQADNINTQVKSKIQEFLTILTLKYNFNLKEEDFQRFLSNHTDFIAGGILDEKGLITQTFFNEPILKKTKLDQSIIFPKSLKFDLTKNQQNELTPLFIAAEKYFFYYTQTEDKLFLFFIVRESSIQNFIISNSQFSNQYLNLNTDVQNDFELRKIIRNSPTNEGTNELRINNKTYLVSFIKSAHGNFAIVTKTDKEKAFIVTKTLISQSIYFGLFLLGILFVAGFLFSISLTNPIQKLAQAAHEVAKGNFDFNTHIDSNDEIKLLSNAFETMGSEIRKLLDSKENMIFQLANANEQLEDYSKNLELKVEQRTFELKTAHDFMDAMVNSLDQGLVVFDKNLMCNDIYTKAAENLFNHIPKNSSYPDLLGLKSKNEIETLKQWADITFKGMIPFESAIGLAPNKKESGVDFHDKNFKMVAISYFPMKDDKGNIVNIVAVGTDKTKEIKAIQEFEEEKQHVSMFLKILNSKIQFSTFVEEVYTLFNQFHTNRNKNLNLQNLDQYMILFHTLNGGFGLYSLFHLQKLAIISEEKINNAKKKNILTPELLADLQDNFEALIIEFDKKIKELDQILGTSFTNNVKNIEVPKNKITELKILIDETKNEKLIRQFSETLIKEPIINYFKAYDDLVQFAATSLGKKVNPIVFFNPSFKINPAPYSDFFSTIIHLFRNCVDHGIELPEIREQLGKTKAGTIEVHFNQNKTHFNIIFRDDGAGIDPQKIRMKLKELAPDKDYSHISDEDILYIIFNPFFTTRKTVSKLSGRGVGMSAIFESVKKIGGKITLKSQVDKGCEFNFILPLNSPLEKLF